MIMKNQGEEPTLVFQYVSMTRAPGKRPTVSLLSLDHDWTLLENNNGSIDQYLHDKGNRTFLAGDGIQETMS